MFKKNSGANTVDQYYKKQINLLPDLYFKKKKRVRLVILVSMLAAVVAMGFSYHVLNLYKQLDEVKANNILTLKAIEEKSEERNRQYLLTALKDRIQYKVDLLKQIEDENASVLRIAEAIESALPENILYINVDFNSTESMTVYGKTEKEEEIPDLLHKLRSMNLFSDLQIDSISKVEEVNYTGTYEMYEFVLICNFGGEEDETN